jgi:hypothetical protein
MRENPRRDLTSTLGTKGTPYSGGIVTFGIGGPGLDLAGWGVFEKFLPDVRRNTSYSREEVVLHVHEDVEDRSQLPHK